MNLRPHTKPRSYGYTIIELTTVLLVIGILTAVAAPRFLDSLAATRAEGAAKRLAADILYMRSLAMSKGESTLRIVQFDVPGNKYTLNDTPDPDHPNDIYIVHVDRQCDAELVEVAVVNDQGTTSAATLRYDLHGKAWSGTSTFRPIVSGRVVVGSGSAQRTVVIDPVTGVPTVQ